VIQTENNYDKDVFNGDIGQIVKIDPVEREVTVRFDQREVIYDYGELDEVSLAYAITIHKSQGSEFPAVVIPLAMQQFMLLQRNMVLRGQGSQLPANPPGADGLWNRQETGRAVGQRSHGINLPPIPSSLQAHRTVLDPDSGWSLDVFGNIPSQWALAHSLSSFSTLWPL
jgi:ATP-dependent RecD-like DNA helicase SH3 domain/UvrD-like helicase C-terminal domain